MNTKYKYSVEEITKYDHSETWFESLEKAQLWFDKCVRQALFRLSNLAVVIEVKDNYDERLAIYGPIKQIVRHGIVKYANSDKVFVDIFLKEYKQ